MMLSATFALSAFGMLLAGLAFCATVFAAWQRNWLRENLVGLFLSILILLGILVASGGSDVNQSQGGLARQILTGFVYVISLWFALQAPDGSRNIPLRMVPLTLTVFLALAFVSATWSAAPGVTLRRAVQFAGVVIFAVAVVRLFDSNELWRRYLNPLLLWLLIGLLVMPFALDFAFDADGNFRGLSSHKNSWAGIALAATILTGLQIRQRPKSTFLWAALLICLVTVLLTRSATAISLAAAALGFGALYAMKQSGETMLRDSLIVSTMLLCSLPVAYLIATGQSPIDALAGLYFDLVQKEATLTGRNILWQTVLEHAWLSPWLGNGYGAFWIGQSGPSVAVVAGLNWFPVHAHNGYIDLFNDLGMIGLLCFAALVLQHLTNIVKTWRSGKADNAAFHLTILLAVLGYNLSETSLLLATHALWVLLIVSVIDCHRLAHPEATR